MLYRNRTARGGQYKVTGKVTDFRSNHLSLIPFFIVIVCRPPTDRSASTH